MKKLVINSIKQKVVYLLYCLIILTVSFFLERLLQMLMFILFYDFIQNCFKKRFHAESIVDDPVKAVFVCKIITIFVEILFLIFCKDLDVALYSNVFVIFCIALLNALVQFFIEKTIVTKNCLKDKETLLKLCKEANLSSNATQRLIWKYVENKTIKEIASIEFVNEETIEQSIRRSKRKLNI